jgi:NAD(P)-dependent dehydrogenase (short-subunit alcohol dehydrogenase family)
MKIKNSVVFVTGSNRGIGKSYVKALLNHGAKKVYAGMRDPGGFDSVASEWPEEHRGKVVPVAINITDEKQIQDAVAQAGDVDLLINNAGHGIDLRRQSGFRTTGNGS